MEAKYGEEGEGEGRGHIFGRRERGRRDTSLGGGGDGGRRGGEKIFNWGRGSLNMSDGRPQSIYRGMTDTEKSFLDLAKPGHIWIVITLF